MYDETPQEAKEKPYQAQKIAVSSDAIYKDNVGLNTPIHTEQVNQTQLRQRGYRVGSLKTGSDDDDKYYKQPGHPLSGLKGRYPIEDSAKIEK